MNTLSTGKKIAYGIGAVGKDMVYALSANYVLYYYQDILHLDPAFVGLILMLARVFDALNDPFMGVLVAKTKSRWGRFRPWLLSGTVLNAVVLYALFAAPHAEGAALMVFFTVMYILWGVTYTMMDIPYWSMIPAFTQGGKERENLTTLARTCAGVGSAIITIATMAVVPMLGKMFGGVEGNAGEIVGFKYFSLIIAALFVLFTVFMCVSIKEKSTAEMKTAGVGEMFKALVQNDQAMAVTLTIVLINMSIYITSNLVIYFFKYDFGGTGWNNAYVLFNMFGGAIQVLSMMLFYPLLRKKFTSLQIFYICLGMAIVGYAVLLLLAFTNMSSVFILFIPAFCIFAANGMLTVITTVFLANTVDYGELKNHRRDESVIFSMQTFVVKLASGVAALVASICLSLTHLQSGTDVSASDAATDFSAAVSLSQKTGLRLTMAVIPIIGLFIAFFWFKKRYLLTDTRLAEIESELNARHREA